MARRKLPIGIQTFGKLREEDRCYVDETSNIQGLANVGLLASHDP